MISRVFMVDTDLSIVNQGCQPEKKRPAPTKNLSLITFVWLRIQR